MKKYLFTVAAFAVISYVLQSCNNGEKTKTSETTSMEHADSSQGGDHAGMNNDLMNSMGGMEQKMSTMKMTGDIDHDFATMMMDHHQGAISMAKVELAKGSDAGMKAMAQKMIDAQTTEISMMQGILSKLKIDTAKKSDGHDHLGDAMREMMSKMKGMTMSGNLDKDFATMMISHHEGAIKMSEDEISHGKNFELKKMAQKMMEDQKKEIGDLQAFLKGK
ncbi:MAG: DUF305 domain-containing protein [Chitinophagaceae bacterium]